MTIRRRAALQDDRGATAIEYAIIGALIGIGLVGALVGTKGSLNAVFGTVATDMGSAGTGAAPALTASQAYWANKRVSAITSSSYGDQITYGDGSYIQVSHPGSPYDTMVFMVDNAALTATYVGNDQAGNLMASYSYQYYDAALQKLKQVDYASYADNSISNGVVNQVSEVTYSASGSQTGSSTSAPSAAFVMMSQSNLGLIPYFQGIIAKR